MTTRTNRLLGLALLTLAALPLSSDAGQAECCNAAASLPGVITEPSNGDEAFFKRTNSASSVMLLLDSSGSMEDLPQCSNPFTGSTTSTTDACNTANVPSPGNTPASTASSTPLVNGTCLPATGSTYCKSGATAAGCSGLAWLEAIAPQSELADKGFGGPAGQDMIDCPPWGNGDKCAKTCLDASGNYTDNCLYDPNAFYSPQTWNLKQFSAKRVAYGSTVPKVSDGCVLLDSNGAVVLDGAGKPVQLGSACNTCLTNHGFYMYNATYWGTYKSGVYSNPQNTGPQTIFAGTFLNKNPIKVVTARRVLKKVLWMDQTATVGKFDRIRFGLADFASNTDGQIVFGLQPGAASAASPYNKTSYRVARAPILTYINDTAHNLASTSTPIGKALFQVGQYFAKSNFYSTRWASAWQNAAFDPASGTCSVCWSCQKNSVVIITDGQPNEDETAFPGEIIGTAGSPGSAAVTCTAAQLKKGCKPKPAVPPTPATPGYDQVDYATYCLDSSGKDICMDARSSGTPAPSTIPRVAAFLHRIPISTYGTSLDIFTIGFNLPAGDAQNVLVATGKMGGGDAFNPQDTQALEDAVFKAVSSASLTESTFNAPSVDSLQTSQTATSDAFLTRFLPNDSNLWEGHVFPAAIFDEFANGCDPTKTNAEQPLVTCGTTTIKKVSANFNGNTDPATGLSICSDAFLIDAECDAIGEDTSANGFMKLDPVSWLPMVKTPAVFAWDAGEVLSTPGMTGYRSAAEKDVPGGAKARSIFTWLPIGAGGAPAYVDFTTANVATLKPYLSIEPKWCTDLLNTVKVSPLPADQLTECAKQIIYFVRGYDIFGRGVDGCRGPGNPSNPAASNCATTANAGERNRINDPSNTTPSLKPFFWKLGDIFHSSPVAVHPPADVFRCDLGYDNQCVPTLHSPMSLPNQTPIASSYKDSSGNPINAWDAYRLTYAKRTRVSLVGANDGMLHAFNGGAAVGSPDGLGNYTFDVGTGEELWAFIPPDLLPKLWRQVKAGTTSDHQYFVDGNTMVRDVWVDGSGAGKQLDGVKQADEYHTMAIVSERSGGMQFTALDVTNPGSPSTVKMLWTFPKPCSAEAKYMGQTWSDFSPRPPPIGPVRLALPASNTQDPNKRGWEERWITMLNGGYDPTLARGRAVFMVDAWTGDTLWQVTDDSLKAQLGFGSGTSMFPVTAAVAMTDIGDTTKANRDVDGFFDTATWGDLGGNLWVARFKEPGTLSGGQVTNWFAARTFEQQRLADGTQNINGRQPFFYMTSNAYEPTTRTLRTMLGSGNREQMTQTGGKCNPNNLLGCCQAGCAVTTQTKVDYGSCNATTGFACTAAGAMTRGTTSSTAACGVTASCASVASFSEAATATITCGSTITAANGAISCDASGSCSSNLSSPALSSIGDVALGTSLPAPAPTRFYSVWAYGANAAKTFSTAKEALAFDGNRYTDTAGYKGTCAGPKGGTCALVDVTGLKVAYNPAMLSASTTVTGTPATADDAGWFFTQGTDERTSSGSTLVLGCATWNSLVPMSDAGGTDMCSGDPAMPVTLGYLTDYVSGAPTVACGYGDAATKLVNRATQHKTTAPPATSTVRVSVNAQGQVEYSTLRLDPGGAPGVKVIGERKEVSEPVYWLEVPRDSHACRHVDGKNCK